MKQSLIILLLVINSAILLAAQLIVHTNDGAQHPFNLSDIASITFAAEPGLEDFVQIPTGTFTMGDTYGAGNSDELPTHSVTLNSFYMSKYEVTQGEYQAIIGSNPASSSGVGSNYPVYNVSWYSTIKYCNLRSINDGLTPVYSINNSTDPTSWGEVPTFNSNAWNAVICNWTANGYRLPTEAEWEFAARGGTSTPDYPYSGSYNVNVVAWYSSNSSSTSHEVGNKEANALGIYDMSGNVYEWCWDWHGDYSSNPSSNPTGASGGSTRELRGGCWYMSASNCRVSCRDWAPPFSISDRFGLRLCRSAN